jgi:N-acetylmuramoyl-L-alanine amidase
MKQNRLILAFRLGCIVILSLFCLIVNAQNQSKTLKRIIIDPGHGGTDPGSKGKYSTEAAIALAISLKLEDYIHKSLPDVEVVLTRTTDVFSTVVESKR